MITKKCLVCKTKFIGRSDKKYCSDQCRNVYNNRINAALSKDIRKTNRILRVNRDILNKYHLIGMEQVSLFSLISEGFILTYFTNMYKDSEGKEIYFCYDMGYQLSDNETVQVLEKKKFEKNLMGQLP